MTSPAPPLSELDPTPLGNLYPKPGLVAFTIVVIVISILAIILRFWARYLSAGLRFAWDDWLAASAVPCFLVVCGLFFAVANSGVGEHIISVPPENTSYILEFLYFGSLVWDVGTSLVRFSVMAFYGRIFQARRNPNIPWLRFYQAVLTLTVVWAISVLIFDALFECEPISKFWRPSPLFSDPGSCITPFTVFLVGSVGNLAVDLLILIVPFPMVYKLNLPWHKKTAVAFSFILGYGVAFISLGRMIMSLQIGPGINTDPTYYVVPYLYWNIAELGLSVLAVCLPAIFQLSRRSRREGVKSILRSRSQFRSAEPKRRLESNRPRSRSSDPLVEPDWNNIYDGDAFGTFVEISSGSPRGQNRHTVYSQPFMNEEGIHMRQEISIAMHDMA